MFLSNKVKISGRFLRSIRIDQDAGIDSLDGYVFPSSLKELLLNLAQQQNEKQQGAFTWTGPYGSGKSSLGLALTSLLCGPSKDRKRAKELAGNDFTEKLWELLPPKTKGWTSLPIIGGRHSAYEGIRSALISSGLATEDELVGEKETIDKLHSISQQNNRSTGGLIIFIDEMGKFLEGAATRNQDLYFLQLLAEATTRSNGRLLFIGILHQAFEEYANQLPQDARKEWAKIQGRFSDMPVNITGEEQIELISRAIESDIPSKLNKLIANKTTTEIRKNKPGFGKSTTTILAKSWPLHPVTTAILAPISRRAYGQNQRSIFSFLSSAEPLGFQDFLRNTPTHEGRLFDLDDLWEYLVTNLESSISASVDSHHFSTARDSIDRCKAENGSDLEISLLKSIALIELTRSQSGLISSPEVLRLCHNKFEPSSVDEAINKLVEASLIIFNKYRGSYAIFEGSDFDIHKAIEDATRDLPNINLDLISNAANLNPIGAKRHYHHTGTLRWIDIKITSISELPKAIKEFKPTASNFGQFIFALPTKNESDVDVNQAIAKALNKAPKYDLAIATPQNPQKLLSLANDHAALDYISKHRTELGGDKIARREVSDRRESVSIHIQQELWKSLDNITWHFPKGITKQVDWVQISSLVSDLADDRFYAAPTIHNELINREKPSGNANSALKQLLHAMVLKQGKPRLGFNKYPAEWGLFASILLANKLYVEKDNTWEITPPKKNDDANLYSAWKAARDHLKINNNRSVCITEIYDIWKSAPYGIKTGVLPLLALTFLLSESTNLAYYRDNIFLSAISDVDADYLLKVPHQFQIRWMEISETSRQLLANMAGLAAELNGEQVLDLTPFEVARALISAFFNSSDWSRRTTRLSKNAIRVRSLFAKAHDPNKFIFDDLPALYSEEADPTTAEGVEYISKQTRDGLHEILGAHSLMLNTLRDQTLEELQIHTRSPQAMEELRSRATNIQGISGILKLDAFILRLMNYEDDEASIDKLVSLAADKPSKNWLDTDVDKASIALTELSQQFNKHETVARVKGRKDKREAMAVIVGVEGRPAPVLQEFNILDTDRPLVEQLAAQILADLKSKDDTTTSILLAALATASSQLMDGQKVELEAELNNVG